MKSIWMLAAAVSLAACAGRGEDDMGAAPDQGDTTVVTTGADTAQFDTTTTGGVGQTAEPGMIPDTSAANGQAGTTEQYPTTPGTTTDTAGQSGAYPSDTTSTTGTDTSTTGGYDSTLPSSTDTTTQTVPSADPGMTPDASTDTSSMSTDSANVDHSAGGWQGDSAAVDHSVPTDSAATPQ